MASTFPTALDTIPNSPTTEKLGESAPKHSEMHNMLRDAIVAVETRVGITGSTDPASLTYRVSADGEGAAIAALTSKTTPVDADLVGLSDSNAGGVLKKLSWSSIKAALQSVFATLAGIAGGQTLNGGTAASETLTLRSTAHATKGKILFGTSAYDEAGNDLGLGTASPSARLHVIDTAAQLRLGYDAANYLSTTVGSTGGVTYATTGAAGFTYTAQQYVTVTDANTNIASTVLTLNKSVTGAGVGAAGLGARLLFRAESSTTADTAQAYINGSWVDATHSSYKSRLSLGAYDSVTSREGLRLEADGSAARIGFYGVTAVVKPAALTTQLTTLTYTAPTVADYAVQDLTSTGGFGFVTKDEGNSVLAVIKNLQDRVGQLETKLQSLGLLT